MAKPYSIDLRGRVVEEVESGASRREAAERYGLSPSVVVIWVQRFEETGSIAAKPSGGSTSPLERHAEFLLGLFAERPDLTLDEIVAAMRKRRIAGSPLIYLPKYSPDLNPIELAFSKLKAHLRKAAEHTIPRLLRRIGCTVTQFSPQECRNFFRHAGYVQT